MKVSPSGPGAVPAPAVALRPINLADLSADQMTRLLVAPPAHLSVDCGGLLAPHPLGACHFVSQLLVIRRRGTRIQLSQVHPKLRHCLRSLALAGLFHFND